MSAVVASSPLVEPSDQAGMLRQLADRVTALEQTAILPVGLVAWCAGAVPNGWLALDGSVIDANRYGQLVAYLGTTTLPNAAGRVIVGRDAGTFGVILATGGVETVTLSAAQSGVAAHSHGVTDPQHQHLVQISSTSTGTTPAGPGNGVAANTFLTGASSTGITIQNAVAAAASAAHTNLQPYLVLIPIIKF